MPAPMMERRILLRPERLGVWLDGFAVRHGAVSHVVTESTVAFTAADGSLARVDLIWGPVVPDIPVPELVEQLTRERRVGALLVRRAGHAVGIFQGSALLTSKVGSHYVQGTTKAGGWSQKRYSRRRENQADHAFAKAAAELQRILLPVLGSLEAVVTGGDSAAVRAVLAEPRLESVAALVVPRKPLPVPDPKRVVLEAFGESYREIPILLRQPPE
ncbi:MAG: acVLRF1 family peptidyl-tRNA hydrolase [Micropruina sp.]